MNAIKNVGTGAVEEILRARKAGKFEDLEDFFTRVSTRLVNRKALESLIKAGAFDRFGERSVLLFNLDTLLAFGSRIQKDLLSGQTDLFGNVLEDTTHVKPQLKLDEAAPKINQHEQLTWERELLGLFLSQHPLELYETFLSEQCVPLNILTPQHDGKSVCIGGTVSDIREITTKNGQKMAFIKIEDQFGEVEAILFPSSYQRTLGLWQRDRVVLVRGKISAKDRDGNIGNEIKVMVDDAREVTHEQASSYQPTGKKVKGPSAKKVTATHAKGPGAKAIAEPANIPTRVYIRLPNTEDQKMLMALKQAIDLHRGDTDVVLVLGEDRQIIKLPAGIERAPEAISSLRELVGAANVRVQ
jgi:DNA polymerase III alpha subunit